MDAANVINLISTDPDFASFRTGNTVDLHQVSIGFTAAQVRPLIGPPPRVGIFNFTNGANDSTYMDVMHNYVALAGLDTPNCTGGAAGDCAGGILPSGGCTFGGACGGNTCTANQYCIPTSQTCLTLNNGPGKLYDILCDNDFTPNFQSSQLNDGGYRLLWAPHWEDISNAAGGTTQDKALATVLQTVSNFIDAGNNLVAECQGIETLEGGNDGCGSNPSSGSPETEFQTTTRE